MKWSTKIGEYKGIGVYIHATFWLIIAWVAISHWTAAKSLTATVEGVAFVLALFGCVLLHEFGHALSARKYGIKTRDITLLPIGGVARLERMPDKPIQELWVALAGPAVNVAIAVALYLWLTLTNSWQPLDSLSVTGGSFLERLMVVNVFLVVFNILPAFPMDGGRVLRALLALNLEYTKATQIAAGIGQAMAILFGLIGRFSHPFLVFIALFVWIGATQEASMVQMRSSLGGIPVRNAMLTDFQTLKPTDNLQDVIELILAGSQKDFPVVDGNKVIGVLAQNDLLLALAKGGQDTKVEEIMAKEFEIVNSTEMLETAFLRLKSCDCHTIPVSDNGQLIGLITMDNVGEFIRIQAAISASPRRNGKSSNAK